MLKRFYSKKSGFTLVEIIIAFAIFAIMASMIVQILNLSVSARNSNTIYQAELAKQEKQLTLLKKSSGDFDKQKGTMTFNIDGKTYELPYDMLSADPDATNAAEGLNYFVSNVDYQASGEVSPGIEAGGGEDAAAGTTTGSQASRMDTRITGTGGIGYIAVFDVIKDTNTYAPGSDFELKNGRTRYFFGVAASQRNMELNKDTLKDEDIPYSQYRLYFYHENALNAAASSIQYTDENGDKYTKNVPKTAEIVEVGYLNCFADEAAANGLTASRVASGPTSQYSKFTIEQMGTNTVRIGTPFKTNNGANGGIFDRGQRFDGTASYFYVEFEGDPELTAYSFGQNGSTTGTGSIVYYKAVPMYEEKYDSNGNPEYPSADVAEVMSKHVNIYGANLYTRKYISKSTPKPAEGGDS